LIPARGGSKGIPKKNLVDLGGRPLLEWTLAASRASARLDRAPELAPCGRWAPVGCPGVKGPVPQPVSMRAGMLSAALVRVNPAALAERCLLQATSCSIVLMH
jgi:hypothetical protein